MSGKRAITVVVSIVLWVIIIIAALFAVTTMSTRDINHVSNIAGFTPLTVQTDSMAPTFNAGDLIIIKQVDPNTLQEGDIITFHTIIQNEFALNTHRIESIKEVSGSRTYITKGDNNDIADTHMIASGDIVGKYVTKLKGVGKLMDFLSSSTGFLLIIVLPMAAFFAYQVYHLIMVSISLKKAVAIESAQEAAKIMAEAEVKKSDETAAGAVAAGTAAAAGVASAAAEAAGGAVQTVGDTAAKAAEEAAKVSDEAAAKMSEAEAALAEANRLKAEYEAKLALAEANRLKAEYEAKLAAIQSGNETVETKPESGDNN